MPLLLNSDGPRKNRILSALPDAEFQSLLPVLEHAELRSGATLWESDQTARYIYFPIDSLISLVYESHTGRSISIATLGRNGVVGTSVVMGNVKTPDRAVVNYDGVAYKMRSDRVKNELAECGDFQDLLVTYTQTLMTKIAQNSICNRLHRIDQQLSRLLLDFADELETETFRLTHDLIAGLLGVRRESVSIATGTLHKRGLINAARGKVTIIDRKSLANVACECYSVVKDQLERSLTKYATNHTR